MGARRFQELVCWQLGRELRKNVLELIRTTDVRKDYDLQYQLRKAARSVTANIAEGFPCPSHAEFARFLDISGRSLREIDDRLIEAVDENLVTESQVAIHFNLTKRTGVAISRLTAYLRATPTPARKQRNRSAD